MTSQNPEKIKPESYLKTLSLIHFALLAGLVLFMIVTLISQKQTYFDYKNTDDVFIIVVPVMAIAAFFTGRLMFKQQLAALGKKEFLTEKLMGYQGASLIRLAFLEGAALFGIVAFLLTGNFFELSISVLLILYFLMLKPTKEKVVSDLNLSYEQKLQFEDPAEIIR